MRRLLAVPAMLLIAAAVVLLGGSRFGTAADRVASQLARWAEYRIA